MAFRKQRSKRSSIGLKYRAQKDPKELKNPTVLNAPKEVQMPKTVRNATPKIANRTAKTGRIAVPVRSAARGRKEGQDRNALNALPAQKTRKALVKTDR